MKIFKTDHFVLPLPTGHRFPIAKYVLLRRRVEAAGIVKPADLITAPAASDEEIKRAHTPEYLRRVKHGELTEKELRRIGFPWSPQMVERSRRSSGATIAAARAALSAGLGINLAGGTHHAFPDRGEGYCVFNDTAIAARTVQAEGRVQRVVIVDCDVHQGNGTAKIFENDPSVFTFSIHGAKNFPFHKETSDLDVALIDDADDATYLAALREALPVALDRAQADLAIYLAGADPYFDDSFGRMRLTKPGLLERDRFVLESCRALNLPVAITMAGGYAKRVEDTADIHFQTVKLAAEMMGV
ncbi:Acetoin utilization protein AcuC [Thermoflexales bacterium]|nr:Acetoin utilization protein AcuC [Thermoflexales bacterium]